MKRDHVTEDQFQLDEHEIVHLPTGARFTAYATCPEPHLINWGMAGSILPDGRDFDRNEVGTVAYRIMAGRPIEPIDN